MCIRDSGVVAATGAGTTSVTPLIPLQSFKRKEPCSTSSSVRLESSTNAINFLICGISSEFAFLSCILNSFFEYRYSFTKYSVIIVSMQRMIDLRSESRLELQLVSI